MGKNPLIPVLTAAATVTALVFPACADTIFLGNGRSMKGIVRSENAECVQIEIDLGSVTFNKKQVQRVERASSEENEELKKRWAQKRLRQQEERQALEEAREQEVGRVEKTGHVLVSALINGRESVSLLVDTGASLIVLSKRFAAGLNRGHTATKGKKVLMTVADGRSVEADLLLLDAVVVEGVEARNVEAAVLSEEISPVFDGLLGQSFLNRFNYSFDNKKGKLILQKIQR